MKRQMYAHVLNSKRGTIDPQAICPAYDENGRVADLGLVHVVAVEVTVMITGGIQ